MVWKFARSSVVNIAREDALFSCLNTSIARFAHLLFAAIRSLIVPNFLTVMISWSEVELCIHRVNNCHAVMSACSDSAGTNMFSSVVSLSSVCS